MQTDDVPRTRELSPTALGLAVQDNLFGLLPRLPRPARRRARGGGGAEPPPRLALEPDVQGRLENIRDADAVDDAIAWLAARGAPFAFVWAGPGTEPEVLRARLEVAGIPAWELDAPGMAAELEALDWDARDRVPAGFRIERVRDDDGLETFARTFVAAFEVPEWAGQAWVDATRSVGVDAAPWTFYVGLLHGEPIATNLLTPGGGVAGVLGVGTLAAARGRGIGAAITLAAYSDARELGYRYGVLFSTELGLSVYRRIGFAETGTAISRYLWRPPEP